MTKNRPDRVVYRAKTKQPMEALNAYEADRAKYGRKLKRFVKEISPDDGRRAMVRHGVGQTDRFIGLSTKRGDYTSPPEGWRLMNRRGDVLVPKKNTPEGKELFKRMEAIGLQAPADPRTFFEGMPREFHDFSSGFHVYEPGVEVMGDKLYVIWSVEPDGVDPKVWERVKLSTYYLAVERDEAQRGS